MGLRILYWADQFWPYIGGVQVLGSRLVVELVARGHEVQVATAQGNRDLPERDQYEGVEIHRFRFREPLDRKDIAGIMAVRRRLANLREQYGPELVHLHFAGPSAYYHLATAGVRPCPWLVTIHHPLPESAGDRDSVLGRMLRGADWVTAVSDNVLRSVRALVPELGPRSSVVYNGLEAPPDPPSVLPWEPPVVLCIGRMVPEKGFDVALESFAALRTRRRDVRMVLAGEGPARGDLQQMAVALGVGDAVEFTGWVAPENVPGLIGRATAVVVPSRWEEPFGLVALEAALLERPVVAARVGGLPEVVEQGRTGLLVPAEDSPALAAALTDLLDAPERAVELGRAGRRRAERMFSLRQAVDGYEALYQRLARRAA